MQLPQQVTRHCLSHRSRLLVLAAALVFLLTQMVVLQHSHDGDLNLHPDCQICLKAASKHDLAVTGSVTAIIPVIVHHFLAPAVSAVARSVPQQRSRAPPLPA